MKITHKNATREYPANTTMLQMAQDFKDEYPYEIVLAKKNGALCELTKIIDEDCEIEFLTLGTASGNACYKRSATLLMLKAFYRCVDRSKLEEVSVQFSVSKGYYCTVSGDVKITEDFLQEVEAEMRRLVDQAVPINKITLSLENAIKKCVEYGMKDKENLFKYRRSSTVNMYELLGFEDYYYGYMVPNTSYIKYFKLYPYDEGFVLQMPTKEEPDCLQPFEPEENIFNVLKESTAWGENLGVPTVGAINDKIVHGGINNLILIQEAFQEKKLAELAEDIASRGNVKFVMIAGPSSSGKTTTSHRLAIQLLGKGLKPIPIQVDNYFVNRENTPVDENGQFDFECLEALDVKLFNEHMIRLANGERVELPEFDFITGRRKYNGNFLQLKDDDVLIIEGIHCLNSKMSYAIPEEQKYKIYVSAMTRLNIDEHNKIPTTDLRLIRRIVRDVRTRGTSAEKTIAMWPSVRRGEKNNIFPYCKDADAVFNSALIYELSVLKQYAEPALFSVPKNTEEYIEAKRLLKFLNYFLGVPSEDVPKNSLLREFIGGGCFHG